MTPVLLLLDIREISLCFVSFFLVFNHILHNQHETLLTLSTWYTLSHKKLFKKKIIFLNEESDWCAHKIKSDFNSVFPRQQLIKVQMNKLKACLTNCLPFDNEKNLNRTISFTWKKQKKWNNSIENRFTPVVLSIWFLLMYILFTFVYMT